MGSPSGNFVGVASLVLISPEAQEPNGKHSTCLVQDMATNPNRQEENGEASAKSLQEKFDGRPAHMSLFNIFSQYKLPIRLFVILFDLVDNRFLNFDFILLFLYFCCKILIHCDRFRDIRNFFRNSVQTNRNDLGSNRTCESDIVCLSNRQYLEGSKCANILTTSTMVLPRSKSPWRHSSTMCFDLIVE